MNICDYLARGAALAPERTALVDLDAVPRRDISYAELWSDVRRTARGYSAGDEAELAIGLGCELKHAPRLVYARGLDLNAPAVTEIGPTCRLCERENCRERAEPPITRTLTFDEGAKTLTPYPFSTHG